MAWSRVAAVETQKWVELRCMEQGTVPFHVLEGRWFSGNP